MGEPVVLVHAGALAEWFKPLLQEQDLTGRYQVVSYPRFGYVGSSHEEIAKRATEKQYLDARRYTRESLDRAMRSGNT